MVTPESSSHEVIVQSVIPLFNFDSAESEVVLAENIKIRKVRTRELNEIRNFAYTLNPIETRNFSFVLEITKRFRERVDYLWRETEQVLTALRLLKKGKVYRKADFYRTNEWEWPKLSSAAGPFEISHPTLGGKKLTLESKEIQPLKDIFCIIQKPPSQLELAIKRFQKTYQKADEDDKIIDFMIAFESLVFRGEQSEERNLPIAISISMLLGVNTKERDEIRTNLKVAYALRNGIVHGNMNLVKKITSKKPIDKINEELEEYLRRSIKKLIDFK